MNRILSFDACRFILALCVVFGHTYVVLFRQGPSFVGVQNLAVDGFFILSGFLIALSVTKHTRPALDASAQFISSMCRRFRRLWPEYFFALVVVFVLGWVFLGKHDDYAIPFNLIFLAQINKFPGIINGSWYVSVLFFGGAMAEYLLITKRQKAVCFWFPLIIFLCLSYEYAQYSHLSLHGTNHFLCDTYSVGLLKGILDMSIGIECYYAAQYISQTDFNFRPWFSKIIPYLWELLGLFFVLYAWASKGINRNNFLVLFGYVILIILLSLKKEHILKFLSWKPWQAVAPAAYMIFLTHVVLLEIIKKYVNYQAYPQAIVYLSTLALAVSLGGLCYHAQKWCFAHLKSALFISRD